jgi:hypothetical protein
MRTSTPLSVTAGTDRLVDRRSHKGRGRDESHTSPFTISYFQSGCRGSRHNASESELTENLSMPTFCRQYNAAYANTARCFRASYEEQLQRALRAAEESERSGADA